MYSSKDDKSNYQELSPRRLPVLLTTPFVRYSLSDIVTIPFPYDEIGAQKG